jgi:hypothetical protein
VNVYWLTFFRGLVPDTPTTVFTMSPTSFNRASISRINISNPSTVPVRVYVDIVSATGTFARIWDLRPGQKKMSGEFTPMAATTDYISIYSTPGNLASITIDGGFEQ